MGLHLHCSMAWDHPIRDRVQTQLKRWVIGLEIINEERGLILRGSVTSYYAKQLAQEVVMESTGLPILCNAIQVKSS